MKQKLFEIVRKTNDGNNSSQQDENISEIELSNPN